MQRTTTGTSLRRPQKYLGTKGLILLISLMGMFIPLSIDLYLPAMPEMSTYFQTTSLMVNLTLLAFYFFFAVGIILFGTFSDKYGRKPILFICLSFYMTGSLLCAFAGTIHSLIGFRIIQALGAGGVMAISTALVKDCFEGKLKSKILAVVQAMGVLAPMIAPIAGALILRVANWRVTFVVLAVIGLLTFFGVLLFQETLRTEERYHGTITGSLKQLLVVGKNKGFSSFLFITALIAAPYMAYITMSSYIYQSVFLLNAQSYSYYFAVNSGLAVLGPILYIQSIGKLSPKRFTWFCFTIACVSGLCVFLFGNFSPLVFLLCFVPFTLVEGAIRPFSTDILLEQQKEDVGAASSLINAIHTILGSVGMALGSLRWENMIHGLGILMIGMTAAALIIWLLVLKRKVAIKGIN